MNFPAPVSNNGRTIQTNFLAGVRSVLEPRSFSSYQLHFDTPSEHSMFGRGTAMEVHFGKSFAPICSIGPGTALIGQTTRNWPLVQPGLQVLPAFCPEPVQHELRRNRVWR
jgi:hypothetical protein